MSNLFGSEALRPVRIAVLFVDQGRQVGSDEPTRPRLPGESDGLFQVARGELKIPAKRRMRAISPLVRLPWRGLQDLLEQADVQIVQDSAVVE